MRMQEILPAALIAGGGCNGRNPDFPLADVKRKMLIGRLERLALVTGLVDQCGSQILHFPFSRDALLNGESSTAIIR